MTHIIRPASLAGTDNILHFVRELSSYEKAEQEILATPMHVQRTLFCAALTPVSSLAMGNGGGLKGRRIHSPSSL
ncbi:MAG: hypothetical protein JSS31_11460 [Proteobacteria bacterium]|nr:hypothetical protein [Pseudomonadota bacterium]MBS0494549.1 hypothetical protein [Pseudomonadota bacterium]